MSLFNSPAASQSNPLDPLLKPRSIALVGVSPRAGSVGNDMLKVLRDGGFEGRIFLVNPRYDQIEGIPCYACMSDIPEAIDMAVLSVAGGRMEALIDEAIALQVGGVTIFDYCKLEEEQQLQAGEINLLERLKAKAGAAGLPICGGNCMGYYNFDTKTHVSFQSPGERKPGNIALLAHSGSVFVLPCSNDPRFRFNLVVSAGQEITTSLADYMDFALDQPSTRVVAVFMEAVRDPATFVKALQKARDKAIPVVITKVGRSEISAKMAATHSGAIAGNHAVYEALFKKYGVISTDNIDDLMNTALLLSQSADLGNGELGYVSDSGGLRELFVDTCDQYQLPFAKISAETTDRLAARLPHGLDPVNPLDAAGSFTPDYPHVFADCIRYLLADPGVAIGAFEFEARDDYIYMPEFIDIAKQVSEHSRKPFVVINSFASALNSAIADDLMDHGVPLINGVDYAAKAIHNLLEFRNYQQAYQQQLRSGKAATAAIRPSLSEPWKARLAGPEPLDEAEGLQLMASFGIPVARAISASSLDEVLQAADELSYPLVLKTAAPGIHHKSDCGGVVLNIGDAESLSSAYFDIHCRLGAEVIVEPMLAAGVEIAMGMINDPQFGPMVMVGSGGVYIEVLKDRCFAMAPVSEQQAREMLNSLKIRPLLDGVRGQPACDTGKLVDTLVKFSRLAAAGSEHIEEIDINPLIVSSQGCTAVDTLVINRPAAPQPYNASLISTATSQLTPEFSL